MKLSQRKIGTAAGVTGIVLACVSCCVPLIAPVLTWLGISTLGAAATSWYPGMAGAFVLGLGAILLIRHRQAARRVATCDGACKVDIPSRQAGDR
jgi:hypothetical protein